MLDETTIKSSPKISGSGVGKICKKLPVSENQLETVEDLKASVESLHSLAQETHPLDLGSTSLSLGKIALCDSYIQNSQTCDQRLVMFLRLSNITLIQIRQRNKPKFKQMR